MITSAFLPFSFVSAIFAQPDRQHNTGQAPMQSSGSSDEHFDHAPKIAIIGAGIAGASAAHHLHQMARKYFPLDITVLEKESKVGGQIMSTSLRHNPVRQTIELGGASFLENDRRLIEAMREVGLRSRTPRIHVGERVGVWDGKDLHVSKPVKGSYRELQRRSRLACLWEQAYSSRVEALLYRLFSLLRPLADLNEKEEVDEDPVRGLVGEDAFHGSATNSVLLPEATRLAAQYALFGQLDTITRKVGAIAPKDAKSISIVGGNGRLPNRMLKISEAKVKPDSFVRKINPGSNGQWRIEVHEPQGGHENRMKMKTYRADFDYVIITSPFEINNIEIDPPFLISPSQTSKSFVERHITYFTCKRRLAPGYFNQPAENTLPEDIFTSLNTTTEDFLIGITVEDKVNEAHPTCVRDHRYFLYKATTSRPMSDHDIAALFGEKTLQPS